MLVSGLYVDAGMLTDEGQSVQEGLNWTGLNQDEA